MLEAEGLVVTLGGSRALDAVNLVLAPGEVVAVIGPNGAGKSTLLACLSGALRPDAGTVRIDAADPATLSATELGRRRAVLEQAPTAAAPFRLDELVSLGIPRKVPPFQARQIARRAMEILGLGSFRRRPVSWLSGGEYHRAHLARALAQLWAGRLLGSGNWLLLDEPTASLDLAHQNAVIGVARAVAAEGAGVLTVVHDLTLAAAMADRVVLMEAGRIVACGPTRRVLQPAILEPVYQLPLAVSEPWPGRLAVTPLFAGEALENP